MKDGEKDLKKETETEKNDKDPVKGSDEVRLRRREEDYLP